MFTSGPLCVKKVQISWKYFYTECTRITWKKSLHVILSSSPYLMTQAFTRLREHNVITAVTSKNINPAKTAQSSFWGEREPKIRKRKKSNKPPAIYYISKYSTTTTNLITFFMNNINKCHAKFKSIFPPDLRTDFAPVPFISIRIILSARCTEQSDEKLFSHSIFEVYENGTRFNNKINS